MHRPRRATLEEYASCRGLAAAFGQRRKTLRNAPKRLASEADLERAGIVPGARGETLSLADFVRLANALA